MFRLKLPTEPRWAQIAESNIDEVLTDHAFCEQKAASTAISLIIQFPEYGEFVQAMAALAQEEMEHFSRVHAIILKRGNQLGRERKDEYVNELVTFIRKKDRKAYFLDKLLFAAMIEARSCERFKVLSETLKDPELAAFYRELMASEANHYTLFIGFARKLCAEQDVDKRWNEMLAFEAKVIAGYGNRELIHG